MKGPDNFLGIPEVDPKQAEALVLPLPLEASVSYGKGTKAGPEAIIKASQQIELFDHELGYELESRVKIATLPTLEFGKSKDEEAQKLIAKTAKPYINQFLISLGGEHSITPGLIRAFLKKYPDLSILYIDAHTDMREQWDGSKWSHACAARRCQEEGIDKIVFVGIRNTSKEEQQYLNKMNIYWGNQFDIKKILAKLSENVYLTFDVDALDIPYMVATGTPEPGGISYQQALDLLKAVAQNKNLVGADFNELAPIPGLHAYDFLVAKLIFKLIGYKYGKGFKKAVS
jgi:agmatinase